MSQQVDMILQQIEHLDEAERALLEERLQELAEMEWKREADRARSIALERGIEQRTIDDAVAELRYGQSKFSSTQTSCRSRSSCDERLSSAGVESSPESENHLNDDLLVDQGHIAF